MEQFKETSADELANFNDIPNELLWQIFRHLGRNHSDLLRMTLVCRRWHQVIFTFLNDRFRFRPEACDGLDEHRTYRHLNLSVCPLPVSTVNDKCNDYFYTDKTQLERQNADEARSIKIFNATGFCLDLLARLLMNFKNLESLDLDYWGEVKSCSMIRTKGKPDNSMAQVKHLKISAKIAILMNVLQYFSHSLVTLEMVISPETLTYLFENPIRFTNLETFKIKMDPLRRFGYAKDSLKNILESLPKLRKLSFETYVASIITEVTEAKTNIEEFELLGLIGYCIPDMSEMKNLKVFRTDGQFLHLDDFDPQPLPDVTTLEIDRVICVDVNGLVEHFPNLTTLYMASLPVSRTYLTTLVTAYPALQVLSIQIKEPFVEMLKLISAGFLKLAELQVNLLTPKDSQDEHGREIAKGNLSIFGGVLALTTLQKLYIRTNPFPEGTIPSISLPQKRPNCRVFVNGVPV